MNLILVGYTPERTRRALAFCALTFQRLPVRHRVLVLNHPDIAIQEEASGWEFVRGSNDLGEFSGWQEGIDRLSELGDYGAIVFLNDTVGAYAWLSVFRRWCLVSEIRSMGSNRVIGFTEGASGLYGALTIGTYCFAVPAAVLARLGRRLYDTAEVGSYVRGGTDSNGFFTERVPPDLQQRLRWWLFEGWHRSEALTPASEPRLSLKARCMFAEFLLSARCRELGAEIRDPIRRRPVVRALEALNSQRWRLTRRLKLLRPDRNGST